MSILNPRNLFSHVDCVNFKWLFKFYTISNLFFFYEKNFIILVYLNKEKKKQVNSFKGFSQN